MILNKYPPAILALADGTIFAGQSFGAPVTMTGEIVFNTSMTGYQEILTDPSYCRQIVTMTCPHIGNVGVNPDDVEADRPWAAGLIVREVSRRISNWRATMSLPAYLQQHNLPGLTEIDTRALVRHIRDQGAMMAA
ncbi:MAG TPA: carbamoyl-phosphate synthase domain-containing protein, partial [Anaerolineae bacterium]|nr:carbamoyl-phosphate synthase domain-containing protein [Anaerolineae bacterium]